MCPTNFEVNWRLSKHNLVIVWHCVFVCDHIMLNIVAQSLTNVHSHSWNLLPTIKEEHSHFGITFDKGMKPYFVNPLRPIPYIHRVSQRQSFKQQDMLV